MEAPVQSYLVAKYGLEIIVAIVDLLTKDALVWVVKHDNFHWRYLVIRASVIRDFLKTHAADYVIDRRAHKLALHFIESRALWVFSGCLGWLRNRAR